MQPIRFACQTTIDMPAEQIAELILDVANWSKFQGYWMLPGITSAEFEARTPQVVGSRIRVQNTDGSSHVEEIVAWESGRGLTLRFQEFSPPVSRLATHFDEIWRFEPGSGGTRVERAFELHPKTRLARPLLWFVSFFLKRAIDRHLAEMQAAARGLAA